MVLSRPKLLPNLSTEDQENATFEAKKWQPKFNFRTLLINKRHGRGTWEERTRARTCPLNRIEVYVVLCRHSAHRRGRKCLAAAATAARGGRCRGCCKGRDSNLPVEHPKFIILYCEFRMQSIIQGDSSPLRRGLGWLWFGCSTILPSCTAPSARFPSAPAELGRRWNSLNKSQPIPDESPCIDPA